jgi:ferric-dicitrate binding protein FerR (iron transport regulator)
MNSLDEKSVEKYLAGECAEADMEQIIQWLSVSEDHRKEWVKLRMVSAKSNFPHFSDPEHVARSYKELRKEQAARKRLEQEITRKITLRFMRYAASILILAGVSVASYKYVTDWQYPRMVAIAAGGNEQMKQVMLDDSTRVWLSAGSRIEYPERFGKKERTVSVEGKAYFEVTKDTKRPFYVKTETYTVKVLGTSFEVNAFKYKQTSDVVLMEGKVEILDRNRTSLYVLQPGQQFEIDKLNNRFVLHTVDAAMYASWHGGKLEFDGQTFAEIAKVLERHYNVRIVLDDGIAGNKKLVGSLSFQKDIHEMMKTIELVVPVKYNVQTDTVVYIQSK